MADSEFTIDISDDGRLVADFVVPDVGHCFQTDRDEAVQPGEYGIGVACHVCAVGTFRVTAGE